MCENQVCLMENMDEVWKIKQVLLNGEHETDLVLADSLRRLHRIDLSCHTLKDTMIGEPVCTFIKNGRTLQIRLLAKALVTKWKRMIDEWVADGRIEIIYEEEDDVKKTEPTVKKPVADNQIHERPNKPLIHNLGSSIQDEDNQAKKETEFLGKSKKDRVIQEKKRKAPTEIGSRQKLNKALIQKKPLVQVNKRMPPQEMRSQQTPKTALIQKKPPLQENQRKALNEIESQPKPKKPFLQEDRKKALNHNSNKSLMIQKKPFLQKDNMKCVDNATRLEATRKRLRENYEEAEKAKRQRKVQVVEFRNLPKQALANTKAYVERKSFFTKFR